MNAFAPKTNKKADSKPVGTATKKARLKESRQDLKEYAQKLELVLARVRLSVLEFEGEHAALNKKF